MERQETRSGSVDRLEKSIGSQNNMVKVFDFDVLYTMQYTQVGEQIRHRSHPIERNQMPWNSIHPSLIKIIHCIPEILEEIYSEKKETLEKSYDGKTKDLTEVSFYFIVFFLLPSRFFVKLNIQ